ncbi:MAG: hypothetical protein D6733_02195 [Methanobacteriota archaeon]|nr:MAG: hypothetical protein D6733_02195 [Euryarchaeota archaeon]
MLEGEISFQYGDEETARAVAALIEMDNRIAPRTVEIHTWADGKRVLTSLRSKRTGTFFATIDDLLFTEKLIATILDTSKGL